MKKVVLADQSKNWSLYTCQLSCFRRESHACGLKTLISRRLTLAGQFLTPGCCRLVSCKKNKLMTIPSSRSLIFEVKSTGSDWDWDFGRLQNTSDFFGRLWMFSGIFGNDRVVVKNPSTLRIKISRLYLKKSWQVYPLRFLHALDVFV